MKTNGRIKTAIFVVVLTALPIFILFKEFSPRHGFLAMVYFGKRFHQNSLPEIKKLDPPRLSKYGYDGQFYAQLALDPLLQRQELQKALDIAPYRARRIGLPWLAYILGLGNPGRIVHLYPLLNFLFWVFTLILLWRFVGFQRGRDYWLAVAILWSSGTLLSLARAMIDLPAATLLLLVVLSESKWILAALGLAMAALIKETSLLGAFSVVWVQNHSTTNYIKAGLAGLLSGLPLLFWLVYVHWQLSDVVQLGSANFTWPFAGIGTKLWNPVMGIGLGLNAPSILYLGVALVELAATLSLALQAAYLLFKPRPSSAVWRLGMGFTLLLICLGPSVWVSAIAYTRVLLPLTMAYNLLIHRHEGKQGFKAWFVGGNMGMLPLYALY